MTDTIRQRWSPATGWQDVDAPPPPEDVAAEAMFAHAQRCGAHHPHAGVYCTDDPGHDTANGHVAKDEFGAVLRRWFPGGAVPSVYADGAINPAGPFAHVDRGWTDPETGATIRPGDPGAGEWSDGPHVVDPVSSGDVVGDVDGCQAPPNFRHPDQCNDYHDPADLDPHHLEES